MLRAVSSYVPQAMPLRRPIMNRSPFLPARVAACVFLLFFLCSRGAGGYADDPHARSRNDKTVPPAQPREFAPGVRIDWTKRTVEVDARVVLREGLIELFACTPGTREYESIVVVRGSPTHVYQAMGLVGLEAGSPVRYDEKRQRLLPPTGQALDILVRYRKAGAERTVSARRWLMDVEKRRPPKSLPWVFAGSRVLGDGRLGAENEGTVVCVVDFDTALIAVGAFHTADDAALWLAANTEEIPPIGTPCTLLIRRKPGRTIEVELTTEGTVRLGGKPVSVKELSQILRSNKTDGTGMHLILQPGSQVTNKTIESAIDSLVRGGIDRKAIEVRPVGPSRPAMKPTGTPDG